MGQFIIVFTETEKNINNLKQFLLIIKEDAFNISNLEKSRKTYKKITHNLFIQC